VFLKENSSHGVGRKVLVKEMNNFEGRLGGEALNV
jgi:hypothetical protein